MELEKKPSRFQKFTNRLLDPGNLTDENVQRNRSMAEMLLDQSTNAKISHPTQGYAQLMKALNSQIYQQKANRGEKALKEQRAAELGQVMEKLGGDFSPATLQALQGAGNNPILASIAPALLGNDQAIANREDTQAFQSGESEAERSAKANIRSTNSYFATANRAYPELGVREGQEVRLAEQTMPNGQVQVGLVSPNGTISPVNSADFASPTSKVTDPMQAPTSSVNSAMTTLKDAAVLTAQIENIEKLNPRDYLSAYNKVKFSVLNMVDEYYDYESKNPKLAAEMFRNQEFKGSVSQIFAGIRKEVTGAQAAYIELKYLEQAFLSNEMSPNQFKGALSLIKSVTQLRTDIANAIINEGLTTFQDPAKFQKELSTRMDAAFKAQYPEGSLAAIGMADTRAAEGQTFKEQDPTTWSNEYFRLMGESAAEANKR